MTEHYAPGDKVTIVRGVSPKDKVVGRSGTVKEIDESGRVVVRGLEPRVKEWAIGTRGFWPDQLRKN
jgi:hypothetical protein